MRAKGNFFKEFLGQYYGNICCEEKKVDNKSPG